MSRQVSHLANAHCDGGGANWDVTLAARAGITTGQLVSKHSLPLILHQAVARSTARMGDMPHRPTRAADIVQEAPTVPPGLLGRQR